jgi:hypothetical protein
VPPTLLRAACPHALERVLMRALREAPGKRYLTSAEMLEDFASEAGDFSTAILLQDYVDAVGLDAGRLGGRFGAANGKSACAARWATTMSCSTSWAPADSAGSTASATCTWSASSR